MKPSTAKRYRRHQEYNVTYGGDLLKTRLGRSTPRPLSTTNSMHLVMRSTKATGGNSFREPQHFARVQAALLKFAQRHGVKLYNFAIQSNHLHLYVQLTSRQGYIRFIRALTGAIARMFRARKFWDRRPFSRIVRGPAEDFALDDYIKLNQIEAQGFSRKQARKILRERNAKESRIAIKRLRERAAGSG